MTHGGSSVRSFVVQERLPHGGGGGGSRSDDAAGKGCGADLECSAGARVRPPLELDATAQLGAISLQVRRRSLGARKNASDLRADTAESLVFDGSYVNQDRDPTPAGNTGSGDLWVGALDVEEKAEERAEGAGVLAVVAAVAAVRGLAVRQQRLLFR